MTNLTIIYRLSGGIYRSARRNTENADGVPNSWNSDCLARRRSLKGIYRKSTEFSANLPISQMTSARQSSSNRKAVGRNRKIEAGTGIVISSRMPMTMNSTMATMMMTTVNERA